MENNVYRIHMGPAQCAVDLGDGSERGEYVDQDYILNRLGRPVMMTDDIRERYLRYLRSRIIPMAEHAIVEDDIGTLKDVIGSGAVTEEDLYRMLEKSVRSGRISSTSIIMSALNRTGTE